MSKLMFQMNRQSGPIEQFNVNAKVYENLSNIRFLHLSNVTADNRKFTDVLNELGISGIYGVHFTDSDSFNSVYTVGKHVAENLKFIKNVTSMIGTNLQHDIEQEKFLLSTFEQLHDSPIKINDLLNSISTSVQWSDILFAWSLIKSLQQHNHIVFNNVIDDAVQIKWFANWFSGLDVTVNNLYYHRMIESNPLVKIHNFKYFPYPLYGIFMKEKKNYEKYITFTVGLTDFTVNKFRNKITRELKKFDDEHNAGFNVFIRSTIDSNLNTGFLEYDEYQKAIEKSKFTLIIPSYHRNVWSNKRFWEAITVDCLPLIYDPVKNLAEGLDLDDELIDIVDNNLRITSDNIKDLPLICKNLENSREQLLKLIKSTDRYKELSDKNYYKQFLKEFYG